MMKFKKVVFMVLVMSIVAALPAFGLDIVPNDDCTIRSGTNYDAATGDFGLFIKNSSDVSYLEFTLGSTTATDVYLNLYHPLEGGGPDSPWDIVVKAAEYSFEESTFTDDDIGDTWSSIGTIEDVETLDVWYTLDVTTWYNANLGNTMSMFLTRDSQPSGSGVVFEDKEGSLTGEGATYGPSLDVTEVPEPATMLLLGLGGLALIRKKR